MSDEIIEEPIYQEPSKDIQIGNVSITLCNELIQLINDQLQVTFSSEAGMESILDAFSANEGISYGDDTYTGYTEVKKFGFEIDNEDRLIYQITLEQLPESPITDDQGYAIQYAIENMPDSDALNCRSIFGNWEDIQDGSEIKQGERLNYNGGLWKCAKTHNKQSDWYPGADPTLFEQLDADEHAGTLEDPIPVPDSVTTSGFTYIVGKYYLEGSDTYKCVRDGMEDGQECKLSYPPSALIGHYFVKV